MQDLLPLGLAFIMFSVGLSLRLDDFKRVFLYPRAFALGIFNQIILLPVIGLALAMTYEGPPEFALGIMILAACPGGITSNLLSVLAGGNAALSVSMTAVTSLAALVSVPFVITLAHTILMGSNTTVEMPVIRIVAGVFMITSVPVILGMFLNHKATKISNVVRRPVRFLASMLFVLIVVGAFIGNMDKITDHFVDVGFLLVALNVLTMTLGFITSRFLGSDRPDSITICLECGLQNAALAIFISINVLGQPAFMVPAIIYALTMNVSAAFLIFIVRKTASQTLISDAR